MNELSKLQTSTPVLKILTGAYSGKQIRLLSSSITIGRHRDCDVIFKDNSECSRYHARIKREGSSCSIESLNQKNPVLINNKPVSSQLLTENDKITIGTIQLLFVETAPVSLPSKRAMATAPSSQPPETKKGWLTVPRLIIIIIFAGLFLMIYKSKEPQETKEKSALNLKTEAETLEKIEELKKTNEKTKEEKILTPEAKAAKIAFIKGFRDYGKGYFYRALHMFQHCLTLEKTNALCHSYSRKSQIQIERLIQHNIRLGNAYKSNKQYEACKAAFERVEIMVKDPRSPVYKEARQNKNLCEIQLANKM